MATMSQLGIVKYSYLAYFSQPKSDRPIYKHLHTHPVRTIVELGVGDAVRAQRIIEMAVAMHPDAKIRYTGVDLFEARPPDKPGLTLKLAYRTLKRLPVNIQLIPGDPFTALARVANSLTGTDLLVIAADQDPDLMARAWILVPRMLHEDSLVFSERVSKGQPRFDLLTRFEIEALACVPKHQLRAAA